MRHDQATLFDLLAANDCLYRYAPEALERINALVKTKGRTLDVGCGDGVIGEALDGQPVVGFDISPRCARLSLNRGIQAAVADATGGFPFASNVFDTLYCVDVLHHLEQRWDRVFSECDRVLKPGGTLVIVEPDARNPFVRWTQAPGSFIRVAPYDNEPAIHPPELEPELEQRGYKYRCFPITIDAEQVVRSVFPLWNRILKAPFVIALAAMYRNKPNKFAFVATKPVG